jgi:hypothetical protein
MKVLSAGKDLLREASVLLPSLRTQHSMRPYLA